MPSRVDASLHGRCRSASMPSADASSRAAAGACREHRRTGAQRSEKVHLVETVRWSRRLAG
jgi:hypothetical protein